MARRHRRAREATGAVERVFFEAREVLRLTGVDAALRAWAGHERFLVAMWEAVNANLETRAFEDAANALREEALEAAGALGPLGAWAQARLGESQAFHVRGALELHQYAQPKLLLLASMVRLANADEIVGQGLVAGSAERIERGAPPGMAAMEEAGDFPKERRVRAVWEDVERTLGPPGVPGEWRALALWPEWLGVAWDAVRPRMGTEAFTRAADLLRLSARREARALPYTVDLSRERVEALGGDTPAVYRVTEALERRLPEQVLALALLARDAEGVDVRPFPAPARLEADWAAVEELS
ncbi:halocarboxylic acid dehydrogenase DehI family protein [Myxococcaceae bacterium GXIMD 01537]